MFCNLLILFLYRIIVHIFFPKLNFGIGIFALISEISVVIGISVLSSYVCYISM